MNDLEFYNKLINIAYKGQDTHPEAAVAVRMLAVCILNDEAKEMRKWMAVKEAVLSTERLRKVWNGMNKEGNEESADG